MKRQRKLLIIGILTVVLFSSTFLLLKMQNVFMKKDHFAINSRISNVENPKEIENIGRKSQVVGWIQIQGTNIDYPIVYDSNWDYPVEAEYYAKMMYYSPGFHNHFEISGHNIFNLSSNPRLHADVFNKFEELMNFVYYDFAKENKYVQLTYENKEYVYKIFAVGFIPVDVATQYKKISDFSEEELNSYLKMLNEYNIYKYDIDVSKNDSLISLSTCTRFFGSNGDWRIYVIGRLLRKNEKMDNYNVKLSDNYNKIEKILRGDEYDDEV